MTADVDDEGEMAGGDLRNAGGEEVSDELRHGVDRQAVEDVVPLAQPRVEDGCLGDRQRLGVIGGGQRRAVAQAEDEPGAVAAEDPGKCHANLEAIEEAAIGKAEMLAVDHAEGVSRGEGLGHALLRSARSGRRLAVGEIDNPDPRPPGRQERERPAAPDLDIIRMGPDGDHVERARIPPRCSEDRCPLRKHRDCGALGVIGMGHGSHRLSFRASWQR